jgi:PAS domain S-box-containing protein
MRLRRVGPAGLSGGDVGPTAGDNKDVTAGPGLPANAETLFQAVAAAADALYVVDAAGCITFLNPAALKILGYRDADELLGRPAHETTHYLRPDGSRFPAAQCPPLRPSRAGETVQLEQDSLVRKDGTQVAVSYSSAAVDLSSGRGVVVAFRDIVAFAMRLESARRLIETAPTDAGRLVDAAHCDLLEAITELRRLAHGIHPAELSRHGLVAALRELARRSAIPVDVEVTDMGQLQPEIEATAYYIAVEATANAVKHGNAGHANIVLVRTANALQLTITDDGTGGAAFGEGAGLQGLRDRADAAGGRLTLVSPVGGPTIVTADLPNDGCQATRR